MRLLPPHEGFMLSETNHEKDAFRGETSYGRRIIFGPRPRNGRSNPPPCHGSLTLAFPSDLPDTPVLRDRTRRTCGTMQCPRTLSRSPGEALARYPRVCACRVKGCCRHMLFATGATFTPWKAAAPAGRDRELRRTTAGIRCRCTFWAGVETKPQSSGMVLQQEGSAMLTC